MRRTPILNQQLLDELLPQGRATPTIRHRALLAQIYYRIGDFATRASTLNG